MVKVRDIPVKESIVNFRKAVKGTSFINPHALDNNCGDYKDVSATVLRAFMTADAVTSNRFKGEEER